MIPTLYRSNTDVALHWVPGHVGLNGNERADIAARLASEEPSVTFHVPLSYSSMKGMVNRAAITQTIHLMENFVIQGSRSATCYATATKRKPLQISPKTSQQTISHLIHLRLGYPCWTHITSTDSDPCLHCLTVPDDPLIHYVLHCPSTCRLRLRFQVAESPDPEYEQAV